MSKTLSAPENTSPTCPVRLSENPPLAHHVPSTPPPEPEAITSPKPCPQSKSERSTKVNGSSDEDSVGCSTSQHPVGDGHFLDSAAATPRLPPSKHGSDDLQSMPSHDFRMLDDNPISSASSLPHSLPSENVRPHHKPLSPKPSLITSLSDINLKSSGHFRRIQQHGSQLLANGTIKDDIAPSLRIGKHQASKVFGKPIYSIRSGSHGAMSDAPTARITEHEASSQDKGSEGQERAEEQVKGKDKEDRRNRSSSRSGRVEKRIEATLAKAEPSSTARSRKSSHLLGLFKDNAVREAKKSPGDQASPLAQDLAGKEDGSGSAMKEVNEERLTEKAHVLGRKRQESIDQAERQHGDLEPTGSATNENKHDSNKQAEHTSHSQPHKPIKQIPPDLLSEIREHRLAVPGGSGSVSSKILSNHKAASIDFTELGLEDRGLTAPEARPRALSGHQQAELSVEGEGDEDSDKEEISSALYYPHEAPSPDGFEDSKDVGEISARQPGQHEHGLLGKPEPARGGDDTIPLEEVDIALQSQNKHRYLHGDLSKPLLHDDVLAHESGVSSASESDYESFDEGARSTSGDEGDLTADPETTPKASPGARPSMLRRKPRKGVFRSAAPFGAVELKPYTHQVGGHSTVYKFSKRAVCKPLSNRENEFYEVIEYQHPELLKFLPRYDIFTSHALFWPYSSVPLMVFHVY